MAVAGSLILQLCCLFAFLAKANAGVYQRSLTFGECRTEIRACFANVKASGDFERFSTLIKEDGTLSIPCDVATRNNMRTCFSAIIDSCGTYMEDSLINLSIWDVLCANQQVFISGRECWRNVESGTERYSCSGCDMPECIRERFPNIPGCSEEHVNLYSEIAAAALTHSCQN